MSLGVDQHTDAIAAAQLPGEIRGLGILQEGIEVEIIDPRTLNPFDRDTIIESVKKTGACIVVEEAYRTLGVGAEIGAMLLEAALPYMDKPFKRLAIPDVPIPTSQHLVDAIVPSVDDIYQAVKELTD